jgi:hypothetical protein
MTYLLCDKEEVIHQITRNTRKPSTKLFSLQVHRMSDIRYNKEKIITK